MRCLYLQIQNFDLQFPKLLVKSTAGCADNGHMVTTVTVTTFVVSKPGFARHKVKVYSDQTSTR